MSTYRHRNKIVSAIAMVLLGGCASYPNGPTAPALMGSSSNPDQFRADDIACRNSTVAQLGSTPQDRANDSEVKSAALGTLVGAALGAAVGGGQGAAVGAGVGLGTGALAGTDAANASGSRAQRDYDAVYYNCMYNRGHQVPDWAVPYRQRNVPPPGYAAPGYPPPPPPPNNQ